MSKWDKNLIQKRTVDDLLAARNEALSLFESAINDLIKVEKLTTASGFGKSAIGRCLKSSALYLYGDKDDASGELSKYREELDRSLWRHLAETSGLYAIMDAQAKKEWDDSLDHKVPECTLENIEATFETLSYQRKMIFNRGLVNCFKHLSKNYKTNNAFRLDKKIIVAHATSFYGRSDDHLFDAERVLYMLDGQKPPEYKDSIKGIINKARYNGDTDFETPYMRIKCFKNGNAHVWLLRDDLTQQCNRIIAAFYDDALPNDIHRAA